MSTPIEIVRAQWDWTRADYTNGLIAPHSWDEYDTALAAVLLAAERYRALERAHDGRSVYAMCVEHHDSKGRFTKYDVAMCTLAELADRLRKEAK